MQTIPREQVLKRFQSLPTNLQDAVFSDRTTDALAKSCALRDITREQEPLVGQLAVRVLLGYLRPENFAFEIQKEAGVDAMKAAQIAHDIDAEVFSSVRLELKKLYPPTIQTPTVERPGFAAQQTTYNLQLTTAPQKPEPRYVVPIPEKFLKKTDNAQSTTENKTVETARLETPKLAPVAPATQPSAPATPAVPPLPTNHPLPTTTPPTKQKDFIPSAKPVIPLPTFIHSKFKSTEKETEKSITDKLAGPIQKANETKEAKS